MLPRIRSATRRLRRSVLRRRRLLAALLVGLAVWAGLRATAAPAPPSVAVTVAARDLPAGAVLGERDLTTVAFARGTTPAGRVRDPVGRRLAAPLTRGSPVTDPALLGPALARARPDLVALPVRLPDSAMAGLLHPGESVDVLAADPAGGDSSTVSRGALVLALPPPDGSATDGLPGRLVVLGVRPLDVAALSAASVTHFLTVAWAD